MSRTLPWRLLMCTFVMNLSDSWDCAGSWNQDNKVELLLWTLNNSLYSIYKRQLGTESMLNQTYRVTWTEKERVSCWEHRECCKLWLLRELNCWPENLVSAAKFRSLFHLPFSCIITPDTVRNNYPEFLNNEKGL